MTLFRKVFQNQSQEATALDAPDEDALREAMRGSLEDNSPLGLDPFAVQGSEDSEPPATTGPGEAEEDLIGEPSEDQSAFGANDFHEGCDAPEAPAEEYSAEEPEILYAEVHTDDFDGASEVSETSEDIAIVEGETASDDADISALLARAREAGAPGDEDEQVASPAETTSPDIAETAEVRVSGEIAESEPEPSEGGLDLSAFARDQLNVQPPADATGPQEPDTAPAADLSSLPAPAEGRAGRRAGRVKTRLLGFNRAEPDPADPFGAVNEATAAPQHEKFPVGWLVVVEGPGVGHSFSIFSGASMIGRGEDQMIRLDFGDNSISRQNHAAIAYDEEQNKFYIGHGGKSNIIRRNARPVLSTEELNHTDLIRIGETTLRFVALCGSDFRWEMTEDGHAASF
ncbi:FHA domain-containing protein [uncultured Roseobacter sp.]|uniref:FHA domain-containing protein n=1 Tax=uncultured Roseobacter sp. TaxID=114847 RepID=UPI0026319AF0|nr:FHA domain-containing protein [uncultured Roseobacter sp.]